MSSKASHEIAELEHKPQQIIGTKLAPYNPTTLEAVLIAVEMLELRSCDILFDLGCGDARFLINAVRMFPSIQAIGIEYDRVLCNLAQKNVAEAALESTNNIEIRHANVLDVEFTTGTAFFIYLVPEGLEALKISLIQALLRNARIVTYVFSIRGIEPVKVHLYKGSTKIYLYTIMSLPESMRVVNPYTNSTVIPNTNTATNECVNTSNINDSSSTKDFVWLDNFEE